MKAKADSNSVVRFHCSANESSLIMYIEYYYLIKFKFLSLTNIPWLQHEVPDSDDESPSKSKTSILPSKKTSTASMNLATTKQFEEHWRKEREDFVLLSSSSYTVFGTLSSTHDFSQSDSSFIILHSNY